MNSPEGYCPEAAYAPASPHTDDGTRQTICPVPFADQRVPAEQPSAIDLDDRDISLAGLAQYLREVRQLSCTPRTAEADLVDQARSGDQAAKYRLIEDRLPYIVRMAYVYQVYAEHEDVMDIVGTANLAVTEHIDTALTKDNPIGYLCGIAKREIMNYCYYRSRLIAVKGHGTPRADIPTVISLDEHHMTLPHRFQDETAPDNAQTTSSHKQLRQALDQLPEHERQVVSRRHGLHGSSGEQFMDIAGALAISRSTVYVRYYRALGKLRELVGMTLP